MTPTPIVSLHRWTDFARLDQVLATCLADLGGSERFVRPGQTVVLKPNITANAPSRSGGTTHVELVEALIRFPHPRSGTHGADARPHAPGPGGMQRLPRGHAPGRVLLLPAEAAQAAARGLWWRDIAATPAAPGEFVVAALAASSSVVATPIASPALDTLVVGDCAAPCRHLGPHIPGCPASTPAIIAALESLGCICQRCRDVVRAVVAGLAPGRYPSLRITAEGEEVFAGPDVVRTGRHQALLVGDCMARYAQAVGERAPQLGMVPETDIVWLRGCPVAEEEVRAAAEGFGVRRGVA